MAAASLLAISTKSTQVMWVGPQGGLACVITSVALAAGCFVSLHVIGALNLLFGYPAITPNLVMLASVAGPSLSALLLYKSCVIDVSELTQSRRSRPLKAVNSIIALAALPYVVLFLIGLCSFPNGWDALAYHIDTALKWLQS